MSLRSIIFRELVYYFGSFLLQDMFLNLQVFAFGGQNMTYTVNVLLTCILNCDARPGYQIKNCLQVVTGIIFALVLFSSETRSFTSRKL